MIEIELSYMNTNHPDFIGFDRCVSTHMTVFTYLST